MNTLISEEQLVTVLFKYQHNLEIFVELRPIYEKSAPLPKSAFEISEVRVNIYSINIELHSLQMFISFLIVVEGIY